MHLTLSVFVYVCVFARIHRSKRVHSFPCMYSECCTLSPLDPDLVTKSMKYVPGHIKLATIIGIGLLLATIGFEAAGVIVDGQLSGG